MEHTECSETSEYKMQTQWNYLEERVQLYVTSYHYEYLMWYLLTYLLHGAESFLRSKLVQKLVKKLTALYGNRRFITVFTSARHLSLS